MSIFNLALANYLFTSATDISCPSNVSFSGGFGVLFSRLLLGGLLVAGEITFLLYLYYGRVLHKNGVESGY